jgi:hypothetical protein
VHVKQKMEKDNVWTHQKEIQNIVICMMGKFNVSIDNDKNLVMKRVS